MATIINLVGRSNTGKTTAIETLDPKETFIINCLGKDLPFPGWKNRYNADSKNYKVESNYNNVANIILKVSSDLPNIKQIVVDDAGYIMNKELMDRADVKDYDKYTLLAQHMYYIFKTAEQCRSDLKVIFIFHQEDQDDMYESADIKIPGKMMKNYYHPTELCTVSVFTKVTYAEDDDDEDQYEFVVRKSKKYPLAKTPRGMFETRTIKADMKALLSAIDQYNTKENK